ncbi:hypothetical protein ERN12_11575 [Rhodobacteraceae bacterium]|nr:hypothetical protein ERN12_11575 [Paracoccaceae bacterium]
MSRIAPIALVCVGFLTACGTPQERCIARSTNELRAVSSLLEDVDGNLARGYGWETYEVDRSRYGFCGYRTHRKKNGDLVRHPVSCWKDYTETRNRRVAIDPVVEARKRDGLIKKQAQLAAQSRVNIAACRRAYPQTPAP